MQKNSRIRKDLKTAGYGITLKIIIGSRVYGIRLPLIVMILVASLLAAAVWQGKLWFDKRTENYLAHIEALEKSNSQYRSALAIKEREREQMSALAEDRFEELYSHLSSQDKEISKINRYVENTSRRAMKGSRSGDRHSAMAIKLKYKELITAVDERKVDIAALREAAEVYHQRIAREREEAARSVMPSIWPAAGEISSDYGWRCHPVYGYGRCHTGLDICNDYGTPIYATAAGTVTFSGWMGGYGNAVIIEHGNGLSTLYGHCSSLLVNSGTYVTKGTNIARMGSTGVSTGPHVHYEVMINGQHTNPVPYLSQR